jgi:arylformamidase
LLKSGGKAFLHESAATVLAYYGCKLVGTDGLSVEPSNGTGETHKALLSANVAILEGLNLAEVPGGEYFLIAPPVKIGGGEAAFTRAVLISDYIFWSGKADR